MSDAAIELALLVDADAVDLGPGGEDFGGFDLDIDELSPRNIKAGAALARRGLGWDYACNQPRSD